MRHTIRTASILAATIALGGCVGYGFPGDTGYPGDYGSQPYPSYPPYQGGNTARTFRCESQDGRMRRCSADTRYGVRINRQLSDSPCAEGSTWGWDRNGIWVDRGCRADFLVY